VGRKRHLLVDTNGLILKVRVHAADVQDRDGAALVLDQIDEPLSGLELIWADGGTFGWLHQFRRLSKDYEFRTDSSEAFILLAAARLLLARIARP
jgi:putative transposase